MTTPVVINHIPDVEISIQCERVAFGQADRYMLWFQPKRWLTWKLRHLADRLDGRISYAYSARMPTAVADAWPEAHRFGVTAALTYLRDYHRDISVTEPSYDPR